MKTIFLIAAVLAGCGQSVVESRSSSITSTIESGLSAHSKAMPSCDAVGNKQLSCFSPSNPSPEECCCRVSVSNEIRCQDTLPAQASNAS